jgi:hypothetical protein
MGIYEAWNQDMPRTLDQHTRLIAFAGLGRGQGFDDSTVVDYHGVLGQYEIVRLNRNTPVGQYQGVV